MYADSSGQLEEFLQIAKKRKWQILLPAVFVFCLSIVVAIIIPQKYHAESEFELRHVRVEGDWQFKDSNSTSLEVANAETHLTSAVRVRAALDELEWDEYENIIREAGSRSDPKVSDYIKRQRKAIGIAIKIREKQMKASAFIEVKYKHVDPEKAVEFIYKIVEMWANELIQRDEALLIAERDELQNHLNRREQDYYDMLDEQARIQKELGVFSWAQGAASLNPKEDPVISELTSVNIELNRLRSSLANKESQLEELTDKIALEDEFIMQPVKAQKTGAATTTSRLEAEVASLRGQQVGLTSLNSTWKRLQMEIDAKQTDLERAERAPEATIQLEERVKNQKVVRWKDEKEQLEIDIEGLKGAVAELEQKSFDLTDEQKERLSLKRQLAAVESQIGVNQFLWEEASKKLQVKEDTLTALIRANKHPFTWIDEPKTPEDPSEPNPLLIIAIGLAGGLALGLGTSMLAEFTKNCYRSVSDVTSVMTLPVLGVVNVIVTRKQRRSARMRGLVVVSSSLVMLAVIGWFTWAYTQRPEILPTEFLQQVEDVRDYFK